jgi:hypothetical protein
MPDVTSARRDGYSTAGSLGHGLGSIERQSDFLQIYSLPSGTVAVARVWNERLPAFARTPPFEIGGVLVAHPGEDICGDDWDWTMRDDRFAILVADGLAWAPGTRSCRGGGGRFSSPCGGISVSCDYRSARRLTSDEGAAVAMVEVDTARSVANYCGVGNISAAIMSGPGSRQGMVSQNGSAGHVASRIHDFSYPLRPQSMIVMHSDGLSSQWNVVPYWPDHTAPERHRRGSVSRFQQAPRRRYRGRREIALSVSFQQTVASSPPRARQEARSRQRGFSHGFRPILWGNSTPTAWREDLPRPFKSAGT